VAATNESLSGCSASKRQRNKSPVPSCLSINSMRSSHSSPTSYPTLTHKAKMDLKARVFFYECCHCRELCLSSERSVSEIWWSAYCIYFIAADKNQSFLAPPSFLPLGVWLPQEYYPPDQEDQLPHWYIEWVDKGWEVTKLTFQVLPLHRSSCLTVSHLTEHQFH